MIAAARTYDDLLALAEAAPVIPHSSAPEMQAIEADNDPYRLARLYLDTKCSHPDGYTLWFWRSEWWIWNGYKYRAIDEREVKASITRSVKAEFDRINIEQQQEPSEDGKVPETKWVTRQVVSNVLGAVESLVTLPGDRSQPMMLGEPDAPPHMIAFRNGILNIDAALEGEYDMRPCTPRWFSPVCLPYNCDLEAECPIWRSFLDKNLEQDQQRINILQEWAGYCLTDDLGETKFLTLEGRGSNGKTVYLAGLEAMLGFENCSHVGLEIFGKDFGLTPTLGKIANICGDAGEIDKIAEGHIKAFTDGNPMTFNRKGLKQVEAIPTAKLMLACNTIPRFADKTDGMARRILPVPFTYKVPEAEKNKGMKTIRWWVKSGELSGIFRWALEGLLRLRKQGGFTESAVCTRLLNEHIKDSNPTRLFLDESCAKNTAGMIPAAELYAEYRAWSDANGYRAVSERTFGKDVAHTFTWVNRKKLGPRGDRFYAYEGISFSEDFQSAIPQQHTQPQKQMSF